MKIEINVVDNEFTVECRDRGFSIPVMECPSLGNALKQALQYWGAELSEGDTIVLSECADRYQLKLDNADSGFITFCLYEGKSFKGEFTFAAMQENLIFVAIEAASIRLKGLGRIKLSIDFESVEAAHEDSLSEYAC